MSDRRQEVIEEWKDIAYANIGREFRLMRRHNQFTLRQMAKRVGCCFQTVSAYERGTRRMPLYVMAIYGDTFGASWASMLHDALIGTNDRLLRRVAGNGGSCAGKQII